MFAGTQYTMSSGTLSVELMRGDVPQPFYRRMGDGTMFVEAVVGAPYAVRFTNATGGRVEAMLAIDGRNTSRDEPADLHRSRGLVVPESHIFRGWRDDRGAVNEFVFAASKRSIAAQAAGNTNNVGVIGLAVYDEDPPMVFRGGGGLESIDSPDSYGEVRGGSVGTGMGRRLVDHVGVTSFIRDDEAPTVFVIRYATHEVLERMGLLVPGEPEPFPGAGPFSGRYHCV